MGQSWRHHRGLLLLAVLLPFVVAQPPAAQPAPPQAPQVSANQVDEAVERGIAWIWSQQKPDGTWPPYITPKDNTTAFVGGHDAMALVALIYAREPMTKPEMKKALKAFLEIKMHQTYCLGFRIIALAELYHQEKDANFRSGLRSAMKDDADQLIDMRCPNLGSWEYKKRTSDYEWDFSNTQVAVLALQQAVLCGVEINPDAFIKIQDLYLKKQHDDGGWNYGRPGHWDLAPSYGSMTAAAVASLLITRDMLDPTGGCPCRNGKSAGRRDPRVEAAIIRGNKWLADQFLAFKNPPSPDSTHMDYYWLYAAERVGIGTGFKYFGQHDWYAEGAAEILKNQKPDGSWGSLSDTSFALLFLIKGRGPVLMNKLMYDGEWDRHPHDLAGLVEIVGQAKEQRINWQVIHFDVPLEDMFDSPILYISSEAPIVLTDAQKKKLRAYTDAGGTLLLEASCGNSAMIAWWKRICTELWPEWEVTPLDKTHPLWSADIEIRGRQPTLLGANDGIRTFLFFSPSDISCIWSTQGVAKNKVLFDLADNLYAYASDRSKLRAKLARRDVGTGAKYAAQTPAKGPKDSIAIARIKHGGDWYVGKNYHSWAILAADLQTKVGLALKELDPVAPGDAIPAGTDLLYLSGRSGCELGQGGDKWLKDYLAGGGFLFAEAVLGDIRFEPPFKVAMAAAGLTLKPLPANSPLLTGQFAAGAGYTIAKATFAPSLQNERIGRPQPELVGIYDGDKLVGIYSPFDILYSQTGCKAFGNRGYSAADARALATNLALFLAAK